jgi:hypothetical protein
MRSEASAGLNSFSIPSSSAHHLAHLAPVPSSRSLPSHPILLRQTKTHPFPLRLIKPPLSLRHPPRGRRVRAGPRRVARARVRCRCRSFPFGVLVLTPTRLLLPLPLPLPLPVTLLSYGNVRFVRLAVVCRVGFLLLLPPVSLACAGRVGWGERLTPDT